MKEEIQGIKKTLTELKHALGAQTEEEWDKLINSKTEDNPSEVIHIRACSELIIDKSEESYVIRYLVAKYDNDNIHITIDFSGNHPRPHIHIGIRKDNYHSASIALDNGALLNNTGNIPDWKIQKIIDWVNDNREALEKMYRCLNPWGDSESADKRKNKLTDI